MRWVTCVLALMFGLHSVSAATEIDKTAIRSIDTGYTISKVRTAAFGSSNSKSIIGSSYEGTVVAYRFDGKLRWKQELSGYMNHDLWCADLNADAVDEVLAANADGTLYCLDGKNGEVIWSFKPNDAPMNAVCVIVHEEAPLVVCGSYDTNVYYLNASGKLLKTLKPQSYSIESPWHPYPKATPPEKTHTANYIRPVTRADGSDILVIHGICHSMAVKARGSLYLFEPLEDEPFSTIDLVEGRPLGELRTGDIDGDGNEEVLMGGTGLMDSHRLLAIDIDTAEQRMMDVLNIGQGIEKFGYRVVQPEVVELDGHAQYLVLFGSKLLLIPPSMNKEASVVLDGKYSYNDCWKDEGSKRLIFASSQSGGSCIHVLNYDQKGWQKAYETPKSLGKLQKILDHSAKIRTQLDDFEKPEWEREPLPVYLMTESITPEVKELVDDIKQNYHSPIFLNQGGIRGAEHWDRSELDNDRYRIRRDPRRSYDLSQKEVVDHFVGLYQKADVGMAYWGGHGNDPYMFQLDTWKQVLEQNCGKTTVMIYPELEDHSPYFESVMEDYFYPLADFCREKDTKIFVRTKHLFWQSNVYLPMWSRLMSGEFADVFVPAMEETTDKSMELSLAARLGVWTSGAVEHWGSRCARDNPSYDRMRQHSHQMVPNHFLRMMVYHLSYGAQYINNFPVDQEYMSLLWELIAKGVLYVPKRSEILSFSPVHLSMLKPDEHYMEEGSNTKWTTFYDETRELKNKMVFSRLNGSWPAAALTEWDFSRYAAGVKDRRLNFLAPYEHGMVLITPPQTGSFAVKESPRGHLVDHLHPHYQKILEEYFTDGRQYYSADGMDIFQPDDLYQKISERIQEASSKLPIRVSGEVAWVVAQSSPTHLRLTVIDSGYLNPADREVVVKFGSVKPRRMTDLLSGEIFEIEDKKSINMDVSCGGFRFIDIELAEEF